MDQVRNGRNEFMLTVRQVASLLGVHPDTVRRWCNEGRLRYYQFNPRGRRRISAEDVRTFIDEHAYFGLKAAVSCEGEK